GAAREPSLPEFFSTVRLGTFQPGLTMPSHIRDELKRNPERAFQVNERKGTPEGRIGWQSCSYLTRARSASTIIAQVARSQPAKGQVQKQRPSGGKHFERNADKVEELICSGTSQTPMVSQGWGYRSLVPSGSERASKKRSCLSD